MVWRQFAVLLSPVEPGDDVPELFFKAVEFDRFFPFAAQVDLKRQSELPDGLKKSNYVRSLDFPVRVSFASGYYNRTRASYSKGYDLSPDPTGQFLIASGKSRSIKDLISDCRGNFAHIELFSFMSGRDEADWIKWSLYDAEDLAYRFSRSEEERLRLERWQKIGPEYEKAWDEVIALRKQYHEEDLQKFLQIGVSIGLPPELKW